jgi:hypothetical protein
MQLMDRSKMNQQDSSQSGPEIGRREGSEERCVPGTSLLDWTALKRRGIVSSRPTLHRLLSRSPAENPFPSPLRHTRTGRRFWRLAEVETWRAREAERLARAISPDDLVPDTDPRSWAPGARRRG